MVGSVHILRFYFVLSLELGFGTTLMSMQATDPSLQEFSFHMKQVYKSRHGT